MEEEVEEEEEEQVEVEEGGGGGGPTFFLASLIMASRFHLSPCCSGPSGISTLGGAQLVLVCLVNGRQEPFGFLATRPHVSYIFG